MKTAEALPGVAAATSKKRGNRQTEKPMATATITPDQDAVSAEIFIAAPPERVFQAITDPQQMPKWWGQQGLYRITEWKNELRPGGKWISVGSGADGTSFSVQGEYLEIDPPRLLVHTWVASWSGALKTIVRWELEPRSEERRVGKEWRA